jgi:hypothetical protein
MVLASPAFFKKIVSPLADEIWERNLASRGVPRRARIRE